MLVALVSALALKCHYRTYKQVIRSGMCRYLYVQHIATTVTVLYSSTLSVLAVRTSTRGTVKMLIASMEKPFFGGLLSSGVLVHTSTLIMSLLTPGNFELYFT